NATIELAGPERMSIAEFVGRFMAATGDKRAVIADPQATYYGAVMGDRGIAPGANPRLGPTRFEGWLARWVPQAQSRTVTGHCRDRPDGASRPREDGILEPSRPGVIGHVFTASRPLVVPDVVSTPRWRRAQKNPSLALRAS